MIDFRCTIIPLCELKLLVEHGIEDLPVWIEYRSETGTTIEATVIQDYSGDNRVVTTAGTYDIADYARDWRFWYAYGAERPIVDTPWASNA